MTDTPVRDRRRTPPPDDAQAPSEEWQRDILDGDALDVSEVHPLFDEQAPDRPQSPDPATRRPPPGADSTDATDPRERAQRERDDGDLPAQQQPGRP